MTSHQCILPDVFQPSAETMLVRLGSEFDGGYVFNANILKPGAQILSFGLGLNWDFEAEFRSLIDDCTIHFYDHTVTERGLRKLFVKSVLKYPLRTAKRRRAIAQVRAYDGFFRRQRLAVHHEMEIGTVDGPNASTVASAFGRLPDGELKTILKCDIEGAEYTVLDDILAHRHRCTAVAMEFHDCADHTSEIIGFMKAMLETHRVDHVAINNCARDRSAAIPQYLEITFSHLSVPQKLADEGIAARLGARVTTDWESLSTPNNPDRPMIRVGFDPERVPAGWAL